MDGFDQLLVPFSAAWFSLQLEAAGAVGNSRGAGGHGRQLIFKLSAGLGDCILPFPPGLGTNADSQETWTLSSCHQALADHVSVSARSLPSQSFASVFVN